MNPELTATIWIAIGGGLGSVVRYSIDRLSSRFASDNFPWSTLFVNITGCFLIGFLGLPMLTNSPLDTLPDARFLIALGVFGGFTTFSCFSLQTVELMKEGKMLRAMLYVAVSIIFCLGATATGLFAAGLAHSA